MTLELFRMSLLKRLIPKINKNIIWARNVNKIDFKVKDNEAKKCSTKNNDLLNVMFRVTPCMS